MLFLDEVSTGLDSSTTYAIMKFLADMTHSLNYTTVIALLQPAPETYNLFDDVLLLSNGEAGSISIERRPGAEGSSAPMALQQQRGSAAKWCRPPSAAAAESTCKVSVH